MTINIYAWATERTLAHLAGRAENTALMNHNRKPYRSKALKAQARREAVKCDDGAWRTDTPVLWHPAPRQ